MNTGEIWYRNVSCSCEEGEVHDGHEWKYFNISPNETKNNNLRKKQSKRGIDKVDANDGPGFRTKSGKPNEKGSSANQMAEEVPVRPADERSTFFEYTLEDLEQSVSYQELERKCIDINQRMQKFQIDFEYMPSIMNTGLAVDEDAMDLYPADTVQNEVLYPVNVVGDGNCLPYTGSIHGFGSDKRGIEMRVRIIVEAVMHKDQYLSQSYLERGHTGIGSKDLTKAFALYSDEYTPPNELKENDIENIFKKEIIKIRRNKTFMGIWQIFALSSVLSRPIFSIYPKLGNKNVRSDLHRVIEPQEKKSSATSYVMWSSTRKDLTTANWIPNHFVAVLPITTNEPVVLGQLRERLIKDRRHKREHLENLGNTNIDGMAKETTFVGNTNIGIESIADDMDKITDDNQTGLNENIKHNKENNTEREKHDGRQDRDINFKIEEKHNNEGQDNQMEVEKESVEEDTEKEEQKDTNSGTDHMEVKERNMYVGHEVKIEGEITDNNNSGNNENQDTKREEQVDNSTESQEVNQENENVEQNSEIIGQLDGEIMGHVEIDNEKNVPVDNDSNNNSVKQDDNIQLSESKEEAKTDRKPFEMPSENTCIENLSPQLLSPDDLVGRHVFVRYDKQPYPGVVTDADESEVYIRCMHRVGKAPNKAGTYYWPRAVKDECWYQIDDVLVVISEPKLENRKFQVDENTCKNINRHFIV